MANNPNVNKVIYGNQTVMDITDTTATEGDVANGAVFYKANGSRSVGTASTASGVPEEELRDTVGWTGKNLLPYPIGTKELISDQGVITSNSSYYLSDYIDISNSDSLAFNVLSIIGDNVNVRFAFFESNMTFISRPLKTITSSNLEVEQAVPNNANYVRICIEDWSQNKTNSPMLRRASVVDDTYEPYHETVEYSKFDRAEQRVLGAKNLLPNNATTQTINGVTFTVNGDGSVTANGTASANTEVRIWENFSLKDGGEYILSGCIGGGSSTYRIVLNQYYSSASHFTVCTDGDELFTFNNASANSNNVAIVISSGQTVNNVLFKPMIRLASDPDNTYVPYAMTNKELTDQVVNKVITLTKAQYDALSTAEKNDPSKVYYVTDYDAPKTYVELDDSSISLDKVWSGQKIKNYADNAYTLPTASSSTLGGVKIRGSIDGLQIASAGNLHLAPSIYERKTVTLSTPVTIESKNSVAVQEHITDTTFLSKLKKGSIIGCEVADTGTFYLIYCISRCDIYNDYADLYFAITIFNQRPVSVTVEKFYIIYTYFGYMF